MPCPILNNRSAFSLIEILAVLSIVAVILFFINQAIHFYDARNDGSRVQMRMEHIVEKAKAYYLNYENLPIILSTLDDPVSLPLASDPSMESGFDIDSKYRFDSWGQAFRYISYSNDGKNNRPGLISIDPLEEPEPPPDWPSPPRPTIVIPVESRTLLRAIEFQGRRVAGLIISNGPDQVKSYTVTQGYPEVYVLDSASDDIILPIDLTVEATQIVQAELKVLNDKVMAFDDRYLGVDDNGDNVQIDEEGCKGILYRINGREPIPENFYDCDQIVFDNPSTVIPPGTDKDINCGTLTLDYMKAFFCRKPWTNCPPGYYVPEIIEIPATLVPVTDNNYDPDFPNALCPGTPRAAVPADYARIPFDRGNPKFSDCHWGLVKTQYGTPEETEVNETDSDSARAFMSCLFNLATGAVVDPWLNGYVWGCGSGPGTILNPETQGGNSFGVYYPGGCEYYYDDTDPRYHRFFSAGPNGWPMALELEIDNGETPTDDILF